MKLTVVMLDRWRTYISVVHENQAVPHGKRLVEIELTPTQVEKLVPRCVGNDRGKDRFEERGEIYLEEHPYNQNTPPDPGEG